MTYCDIIKDKCPTPNKDCKECQMYIMNDMMKALGVQVNFIKAEE